MISRGALPVRSQLLMRGELGGHPHGDADLLIAATSLEHGRVLVTGRNHEGDADGFDVPPKANGHNGASAKYPIQGSPPITNGGNGGSRRNAAKEAARRMLVAPLVNRLALQTRKRCKAARSATASSGGRHQGGK